MMDCVLMVTLLTVLSGCNMMNVGPLTLSTPTPEPTPEPTPSPIPVVALVNAGEDKAFFKGVQESVEEAGLQFSGIDRGLSGLSTLLEKGACSVIVYVKDEMDDLTALSALEYPVLLYQAGSRPLPKNFAAVEPENGSSAVDMLSAALTYPPHNTPVRLIGLFDTREGDAFAIWTAGVTEGRVLSKGVYVAAEAAADELFADWLSAKLSRYYPGMVDAIYSETGSLAVETARVLAKADRADMEIFSAGTDGNVFEMMRTYPKLLVAAAGVDPEAAGRACAERAIGLLAENQKDVTTLPAQIHAAAELQ
ncbi:MAG: hypothetical protein RR224_01355 [Clostridia bacterium]